jgi:hypothetical protein
MTAPRVVELAAVATRHDAYLVLTHHRTIVRVRAEPPGRAAAGDARSQALTRRRSAAASAAGCRFPVGHPAARRGLSGSGSRRRARWECSRSWAWAPSGGRGTPCHRSLDEHLSTPYAPYHAHDTLEPLTPGEAYELDIELWPACVVLPAGCRLALTVRGEDFERPTAAAAPASFVNPFRGSGPFHPHQRDGWAGVRVGWHAHLHGGGACVPYVLLSLIPDRDSE